MRSQEIVPVPQIRDRLPQISMNGSSGWRHLVASAAGTRPREMNSVAVEVTVTARGRYDPVTLQQGRRDHVIACTQAPCILQDHPEGIRDRVDKTNVARGTHTRTCATSTGVRCLSAAVDHRRSQKLPQPFCPATHVVHQSMVAIRAPAFYLQVGCSCSPARARRWHRLPFSASCNAGGSPTHLDRVVFGPLSTKDIQLTICE
jgi:hypothetical protein